MIALLGAVASQLAELQALRLLACVELDLDSEYKQHPPESISLKLMDRVAGLMISILSLG